MGNYLVTINDKEYTVEAEELPFISILIMAGLKPTAKAEVTWVNLFRNHSGKLLAGNSLYLNTMKHVVVSVKEIYE